MAQRSYAEVAPLMSDFRSALKEAWGFSDHIIDNVILNKNSDEVRFSYLYDGKEWLGVPPEQGGISAKNPILASILLSSTAGRLYKGDNGLPKNDWDEPLKGSAKVGSYVHNSWNYYGGDKVGMPHVYQQDNVEKNIAATLAAFAPFGVEGIEEYCGSMVFSESEFFREDSKKSSSFLKDSYLGVHERAKAGITLYAVENAEDYPFQNFLAWSGLYKEVKEYFNGNIPLNIFFTDFWSFRLDWNWDISFDQLRSLVLPVVNSTVKDGKQYIRLEDLDPSQSGRAFRIWFEERYYITVHEEGKLILDDRGRYIQNVLVRSPFTTSEGESWVQDKTDCFTYSEADVAVLDSYGIFMEYFMKICNQLQDHRGVIAADQVFRKQLQSATFWCAEEERGGSIQGKRAEYEQGVVQCYECSSILSLMFPFSFNTDVNEDGYVGIDSVKTPGDGKRYSWKEFTWSKQSQTDIRLDQVAFHEYNLVRMHKGAMNFTNGSHYHTSLGAMNVDPIKIFFNILHQNGKKTYKEGQAVSVSEAVEYLFGIQCSSEEKAETFVKKAVTIASNTKISKASKREGLIRAVSAQMLLKSYMTKEVKSISEVLLGVRSVAVEYETTKGRDEIAEKPAILALSPGIPGQCHRMPEDVFMNPYKIPENNKCKISSFAQQPDGRPSIDVIYGQKTVDDLVKITSDIWSLTFDQEVTYSDPEGNEWFTDQGVHVKKGTLLAKLSSFKDGKKVFTDILAPKDMIVQEIIFRYESSGDRIFGLDAKVKGFVPESIAKLRGEVKTIPVIPENGSELAYNNLNYGIPEGVQVVTTLDAYKAFSDIRGSFATFAQTAAHTEEGRAVIRSINEEWFGKSDSFSLEWSVEKCSVGAYKPLQDFILKNYQRMFWTKEQCSASSESFSKVLYPMYKNRADHDKEEWTELSEEQKSELTEFKNGQFDLGVTVFANCNSFSELDENKTTLLVFDFSSSEKELMFCKSPALVGNQEYGHVYMPTQPELSAIPQIQSISNVLPNIASTIETGCEDAGINPNPALAKYLMTGAVDKPKLWAAFSAMLNRKGSFFVEYEGKKVALPKMSLFTEKDNTKEVNPELINKLLEYDNGRLYNAARNGSLTLEAVSDVLQDIVLDTGDMYLHFPSLFKQEGEPSGDETMAAQAKEAIRHILAAPSSLVEGAQFHLGKCKGLMQSLVNSNSLRKMRGVTGVYGKIASHYSVKVNTLQVYYSEHPDSWYQYLVADAKRKGVKEKDLNGMHGLFTRMPMPFGCVVKVEVVYPGQWTVGKGGNEIDIMNLYQPLLNPYTAYVEAGDWDGDDRLFVLIPNSVHSELISYEKIFSILQERTGVHPLSVDAKGLYIQDHFDASQSGKKQFAIGNAAKHLFIKDRRDLVINALQLSFKGGKANLEKLYQTIEELEKEQPLPLLYRGSTYMQGSAVGGTHKIANISSYAWAINKAFKQADLFSYQKGFFEKGNWQLVGFELYENPLGGFGWAIFRLCQILIDGGIKDQDSNTKRKNPSSVRDYFDIQTLADEAGLNAAEIDSMNDAADYVSNVGPLVSLNTCGNNYPLGVKDYSLLVNIVAGLAFRIDKGQCNLTVDSDLSDSKEPNWDILRAAMFVLKFPKIEEARKSSQIVDMVYEFIAATLPASLDRHQHPNWCRELSKLGLLPELIINNELIKAEPGVEVKLSTNSKHYSQEVNEYKATPKNYDLEEFHKFLLKELRQKLPKSKFGVADNYVSILESYIAPLISSLSEDQVGAIHMFFFGEEHTTVLSGAGGTGKSYVTGPIMEIVRHVTNAYCIPMASSGSAAENLDPKAKTFGSISGQAVSPITPLGEETPNANSPLDLVSKVQHRSGVDLNSGRHVVFIIDEVSMLSAEQLKVFYDTARLAFNTNFGVTPGKDVSYPEDYGFDLLLVGDMPQLPPVEGSPAYYEQPFDSQTSVFDNADFAGLYINHRVKSESGSFGKELLKVSEGEPLEESSEIVQRVKDSIWTEYYSFIPEDCDTALFMSNREASLWNERILEKLGGFVKTFSIKVNFQGTEWYLGKDKEFYLYKTNGARKSLVNQDFIPKWVEPSVTLAVGMKFMLRENDRYNRWVNGTVGEIVGLQESSITLSINGEIVVVPEMTSVSTVEKHGETIISFKGLLGHPAHALTIQKSQGLTIQGDVAVHLNHTAADTPGLTYTALSRVRSSDQLYICIDGLGRNADLLNSCIGADPKAVSFRKAAEESLQKYVESLDYTMEEETYVQLPEVSFDVIDVDRDQKTFELESDSVYILHDEENLWEYRSIDFDDEDGLDFETSSYEEFIEYADGLLLDEEISELKSFIKALFSSKKVIDKPSTEEAYASKEISSDGDILYNEATDNLKQLSAIKEEKFSCSFNHNKLTVATKDDSVSITFVSQDQWKNCQLYTSFGLQQLAEIFSGLQIGQIKTSKGSPFYLKGCKENVECISDSVEFLSQSELKCLYNLLKQGKLYHIGMITKSVSII